MEPVYKQPKLSREDVLAEYAKTGLSPLYAEIYWKHYSSIYDELDGSDDDSDWALESARYGLEWYIRYKEIGHPDSWCEEAFHYGSGSWYVEFTLENMAECLYETYLKHRINPESRSQAEEELHRHCDYIARTFGKSPVFMRLFREWYEGGSGGRDLIEEFERMESLYNEAIAKGKDDDFAYFYATWPGREAWHLAEVRESLQKDGWDEDYVGMYLHQYEEGLLTDGRKRQNPAVPTFWEEEVIAYMRGWDYARKHQHPHEFIKMFQNVFLNLAYKDSNAPTAIDDDAVIEEMKASYTEDALKEVNLC